MKPTEHMSERELREEIANLRASKSLGIAAATRLQQLQLQLTERVTSRYGRMRDEELRVKVARLQRQREKATEVAMRQGIETELRLAIQVAQVRSIALVNDPSGRRVTRRELYFHSMSTESLQRALSRMRKSSKVYQQALAVAIARGLDV